MSLSRHCSRKTLVYQCVEDQHYSLHFNYEIMQNTPNLKFAVILTCHRDQPGIAGNVILEVHAVTL